VPEVVNRPRENFSGYLPCINAGKRMPPKAMIVSPVAPVRAVKMAQAKRAMIDNPPGNHPKSASESLINLLGAPLSERRYPAKVKSGIATRMGVVAIRYISMIMAEESIWLEKNRNRDRPEMIAKMGAPKRIKRKMAMIKRKVISLLPDCAWS
jgi:hypothetical protein